MLKSETLRRHLSDYGTIWLLAFLLVMGGALIANLIFRVEFASVANVLLAIAFFCLIVLTALFLLGAIFGDEPPLTKLALCLGAVLLFLPLMYAPVLAMQIYAFFGQYTPVLEETRMLTGFREVVQQTSTALITPIIGGTYVAGTVKFLQIAATIIGLIAAAAQLNQMRRKRGESVEV